MANYDSMIVECSMDMEKILHETASLESMERNRAVSELLFNKYVIDESQEIHDIFNLIKDRTQENFDEIKAEQLQNVDLNYYLYARLNKKNNLYKSEEKIKTIIDNLYLLSEKMKNESSAEKKGELLDILNEQLAQQILPVSQYNHVIQRLPLEIHIQQNIRENQEKIRNATLEIFNIPSQGGAYEVANVLLKYDFTDRESNTLVDSILIDFLEYEGINSTEITERKQLINDTVKRANQLATSNSDQNVRLEKINDLLARNLLFTGPELDAILKRTPYLTSEECLAIKNKHMLITNIVREANQFFGRRSARLEKINDLLMSYEFTEQELDGLLKRIPSLTSKEHEAIKNEQMRISNIIWETNQLAASDQSARLEKINDLLMSYEFTEPELDAILKRTPSLTPEECLAIKNKHMLITNIVQEVNKLFTVSDQSVWVEKINGLLMSSEFTEPELDGLLKRIPYLTSEEHETIKNKHMRISNIVKETNQLATSNSDQNVRLEKINGSLARHEFTEQEVDTILKRTPSLEEKEYLAIKNEQIFITNIVKETNQLATSDQSVRLEKINSLLMNSEFTEQELDGLLKRISSLTSEEHETIKNKHMRISKVVKETNQLAASDQSARVEKINGLLMSYEFTEQELDTIFERITLMPNERSAIKNKHMLVSNVVKETNQLATSNSNKSVRVKKINSLLMNYEFTEQELDGLLKRIPSLTSKEHETIKNKQMLISDVVKETNQLATSNFDQSARLEKINDLLASHEFTKPELDTIFKRTHCLTPEECLAIKNKQMLITNIVWEASRFFGRRSVRVEKINGLLMSYEFTRPEINIMLDKMPLTREECEKIKNKQDIVQEVNKLFTVSDQSVRVEKINGLLAKCEFTEQEFDTLLKRTPCLTQKEYEKIKQRQILISGIVNKLIEQPQRVTGVKKSFVNILSHIGSFFKQKPSSLKLHKMVNKINNLADSHKLNGEELNAIFDRVRLDENVREMIWEKRSRVREQEPEQIRNGHSFEIVRNRSEEVNKGRERNTNIREPRELPLP